MTFTVIRKAVCGLDIGLIAFLLRVVRKVHTTPAVATVLLRVLKNNESKIYATHTRYCVDLTTIKIQKLQFNPLSFCFHLLNKNLSVKLLRCDCKIRNRK